MSEKRLLDYQFDILLKELEILQFKITEYDKFSLQIKGWAITLWSGIILWGLYALLSGTLIIIILVMELAIFWFLDTLFKIYQRYHVVRLEWIQDYINNKNRFINVNLKSQVKKGEISGIFLFDINSSMGSQYDKEFKKKLKRKKNILRCFFVRNVFPLYVILLIVGILIGLYLDHHFPIVMLYYFIISLSILIALCIIFTYIHKEVIIPGDQKPCEPLQSS